MKAFIAALAVLCVVSGTIYKGIDISYYSGTVSSSTFTCIKNAGYSYVIIEAWVEKHSCPVFTQNYQNAIAAGIQQVDAYAFICNSCMGGSGNVESIVSGLKSVLPSGFNGRIWLDIEYASGIWSGSGSANMEFAQSVASALQSAGYTLGIYTNKNNWEEIMGSAGFSSNPFSNLPLWYPRYDNNPNPAVGCSVPFAGWNSVAIKQYNENIKVCGVNTDVNVAPAIFPNGENGSAQPANNEGNTAPPANTPPANNENTENLQAAAPSSQQSTAAPSTQAQSTQAQSTEPASTQAPSTVQSTQAPSTQAQSTQATTQASTQ